MLLDGWTLLRPAALAQAQTRLAAATELTFKECAERYIAAHEASWKNKVHRAQWPATLTAYAYPTSEPYQWPRSTPACPEGSGANLDSEA
jgi:hypothetical protein